MAEHKPEKIVVIGGGLLGSLTALFAARAGYDVTLLEKSPTILSGAATVMARDHSTGMEYPADKETGGESGKACMHSSMILNTVWKGVGIHTTQPSIWFTTDKEMEMATNKEIDLPGHYKQMLEAYNSARKAGEKMLKNNKKALEEFKTLFKERIFPEKYDAKTIPGPLKGKERYFRNADVLKGAIQTEEKGFDIIRRLSLLEAAIQKEVRLKHIKIKTNCDVGRVEKEGGRFAVYNTKGGKVGEAAQVFNAAGEGLLKMNHPSGVSLPPLVNEYRKIGLISVNKAMDIPSAFILGAEHSYFTGMYSRQNNHCALLYIPLPPKETPDDIDAYLEQASRVFPGLAQHGAKGLRLLWQPLMISQNKELEKRRYLPTAEPTRGYSWGYALKGVYAERMAIEAVERFQRRTANKTDSWLSKWMEENKEGSWDKTLKTALTQDKYSMKKALKGLNIAPQSPEQKRREEKFVQNRLFDIDPHLLNDISYAHYRQQHPRAEKEDELMKHLTREFHRRERRGDGQESKTNGDDLGYFTTMLKNHPTDPPQIE